MFNITDLTGARLEVILNIAWDIVNRERTGYQNYFLDYHSNKLNLYEDYSYDKLDLIKLMQEEAERLNWEIEDLETEKFFSLLGFKKGTYIKGKNGRDYYVYGYFGNMKTYSNVNYTSVCLTEVNEKFCEEKVKFGNTFNVYFDINKVTRYGTSEKNYTDFYIT